MTYVLYEFTPGDEPKFFEQFRSFLRELLRKHEARLVPSEMTGEEPIFFEGQTVTLQLYTPGLSDNYLDEPEDAESAASEFEYFGRSDGRHPPKPEVAFAVAFGDSGDDEYYLSDLDSSMELFEDEETFSSDITTDLTPDEARELMFYLKKVKIQEKEIFSED